MKKRIFVAFVLCLCVFFAISAYAEVVDSGKCGENLVWTLDDEGTLTISGEGQMHCWEFNAPWSSSSKLIKKVIVNDGVTTISDNAFANCVNLTDISIPDSVTSLGLNGAFFGCKSLKSIYIPANVVSGLEYGVFRGCIGLERIDVNKNNTAYISDEDGVLFSKDMTLLVCYPVGKMQTSYAVPDGVTTIGSNAFSFSGNLHSVVLPESIECISDSAFGRCTNLQSINLPESIKSIKGYAFGNCLNLKNINIPGKLEYICADSFENTPLLNDDSKYENGVLYIGKYLLCAKDDIKTVTVKDGTELIADGAFGNCQNLESAVLPGSIKSMTGAFVNAQKLKVVELQDGITEIGGYTFSAYDDILRMIIPESVTQISDYSIAGSSRNLVIYGVPGSCAETYANKRRIEFFAYTGTATPTNAKVLVNGKEIAFTAYNIGGNNYFKLRDVAMAINGSEKNFGVGWDKENNAIALTKNQAYTPVGGELVVDASATATKPAVTDSTVYVDGKEASFAAFNIKNNNYFKLRDIGKVFDFGIGWDNATKTITIDTSVSYTE